MLGVVLDGFGALALLSALLLLLLLLPLLLLLSWLLCVGWLTELLGFVMPTVTVPLTRL